MPKYKKYIFVLLIISIGVNVFLLSYKIHIWKLNKVPINHNIFYKIKQSQYDSLSISNNDIVFIGNSIFQFFETSEFFPNLHIKNRGIGGDNTEDMLTRLPSILNQKPKKIIIEIGINDLLNHLSKNRVKKAFNKIIEELNKNKSSTQAYILNVLPSNYQNDTTLYKNIVELNAEVKEMCLKSNIVFIDCFAAFSKNNALNNIYDVGDNLHLNVNGYLKLKQILLPYILN